MARYDSQNFTEQLPGMSFSHDAGMTAPGSVGSSLTDNAPVLASGVVVSEPYRSSQVAPDMASVSLGDTAAMSYGPVPRTGDPLTGISAEALTTTGAGMGHVNGPPHPTAGGGHE